MIAMRHDIRHDDAEGRKSTCALNLNLKRPQHLTTHITTPPRHPTQPPHPQQVPPPLQKQPPIYHRSFLPLAAETAFRLLLLPPPLPRPLLLPLPPPLLPLLLLPLPPLLARGPPLPLEAAARAARW